MLSKKLKKDNWNYFLCEGFNMLAIYRDGELMYYMCRHVLDKIDLWKMELHDWAITESLEFDSFVGNVVFLSSVMVRHFAYACYGDYFIQKLYFTGFDAPLLRIFWWNSFS